MVTVINAQQQFNELRAAYIANNDSDKLAALRNFVRDIVRQQMAQVGMREDNTVTVKVNHTKKALNLLEFTVTVTSPPDPANPKSWSSTLILSVASLDGVRPVVTIQKHKVVTDNRMLKVHVQSLVTSLVQTLDWRHH